jgi:hypothetical protein
MGKWDDAARAAREHPELFEPTVADLEIALTRKRESLAHDEKRIACDRALVDFLKAKQAERGEPVTPGMFVEDVKRIYAEHGLKPPPGAPKGAE